jgi:hypothetical protein
MIKHNNAINSEQGRGLLCETMVDGVAHQFGVVMQVHLFQDAAAVGADGLHAQGQSVGDLRNGLGRREQQEYLVFAVRQGLMRKFIFVSAELVGEHLGHRRADVFLAAGHAQKKIRAGVKYKPD